MLTDTERQAVRNMVRQALQNPNMTSSTYVRGVQFGFTEYPRALNQWITYPQFSLTAATIGSYSEYSIPGYLYAAFAWRGRKNRETYAEVATLLGAPGAARRDPRTLTQIATGWAWPSDAPGARDRLMALAL